jgi:hypothetical protein
MKLPVRQTMCRTCIFRRDGNQVDLRPGRLDEIQAYLVKGTPHVCHTPASGTPRGSAGDYHCRGGRDWQLTMWYRMGLISAATDEALEEAMRANEKEVSS